MQTLGQRLRAEREKKGFSIPELASRTRIREAFFEAIEADQPERFPGRFFYRSFLRQYAELLGLPESEVQAEIERSRAEEQSENAEREALLQQSKPEVAPLPTGRIDVRAETRRWLVGLAGLIGVVALCSVAFFLWEGWGQRYLDQGWRNVWTRRAHPVEQSHAAHPQNTPAPAQAQPGQTPPAQTATGPATTPPGAAQPTDASQPPTDVAPAGVRPHGLIELRATGDSWVSGWRDGKMFLAVTMRAGETRMIQGGGVVRLQFGNAGEIAVRVDGAALPPIGAKGETRAMEYHDGAYRLLDRGKPAEQKPTAN